MALINCIECGKEISDKAGACPHCGCPASEKTVTAKENTSVMNDPFLPEPELSKPNPEKKKQTVIVAGIITITGVLLALIVTAIAILSGDNGQPTVAPVESTTAAVTSKTESQYTYAAPTDPPKTMTTKKNTTTTKKATTTTTAATTTKAATTITPTTPPTTTKKPDNRIKYSEITQDTMLYYYETNGNASHNHATKDCKYYAPMGISVESKFPFRYLVNAVDGMQPIIIDGEVWSTERFIKGNFCTHCFDLDN